MAAWESDPVISGPAMDNDPVLGTAPAFQQGQTRVPVYPRDPNTPDTIPSAEVFASTAKPTLSSLITGTPTPDKYQQAAIDERDRLAKLGGLREGLTQRAQAGAGMGWADEIMAGATVPLEMIKRGTLDPSEAYNYTIARERLARDATRANTNDNYGIGAAAEVAGGLGGVSSMLGSGTRLASRGLNYLRNIGKASLVGGVAGAGGGDDFDDRVSGALWGTAIGGGLGAALPPVAAGISKALPAASKALQISRARNPLAVADETMADLTKTANVTPQQLTQWVSEGSASGQPYAVADALGKEGQRKLAGLAKVPGEARDVISETLGARDLNMPYRVSNQIGETLGAPSTAEAARRGLINEASTQAAPLYRQAERVPTWSPRVQEFLDDPIATQGLRQGVELQRLRAAGTGRPFNPSDAAITHFNEAGDPVIGGVPNMRTLHTLKTGLDSLIAAEINPATYRMTARGEALNGFKQRLLGEIDSLNPAYAQARRAYAGPLSVNDAIVQGQRMPTQGRFQDTISNFRRMSPTEQQGARIGYADTVRKQVERTGNFPSILREKSLKGSNELDQLSLYQGPNRPGAPSQPRQRLTREEEMLQTSRAALGGSPTAENLADMASGLAPAMSVATSAATHNPVGVLKGAYDIAKSFGAGESSRQRLAIARALMETNPDKVAAMGRRIAALDARRRGVNPFVDRPPRYGP